MNALFIIAFWSFVVIAIIEALAIMNLQGRVYILEDNVEGLMDHITSMNASLKILVNDIVIARLP